MVLHSYPKDGTFTAKLDFKNQSLIRSHFITSLGNMITDYLDIAILPIEKENNHVQVSLGGNRRALGEALSLSAQTESV